MKEQKGHIATAVKALEKQVAKYKLELDKLADKADSANKGIMFYRDQIERIQQQIKALKNDILEPESSVSSLLELAKGLGK